MKSSISFVCQECGYTSPQFLGKCPECGMWSTLKKFQISNVKSQISNTKEKIDIKPRTLDEISYEEKQRLSTTISELDGVLGGGIVAGSVTLLAGDPGIGKSTLLLQVGLSIAALRSPRQFADSSNASTPAKLGVRSPSATLEKNTAHAKAPGAATVLYISGEESAEQIKLRANRIAPNFSSKNFLLLSLRDTDAVVQVIQETNPQLVIIDSIQTMESVNLEGMSGSVGQVRYATSQFIKLAKTFAIPIILVGHVTKEGMVAGPMVLSHMVDTVLFFEGEKTTHTRILRSLKNRFGPVDEVGVFVMEEGGIKEVKNPNSLFVSDEKKQAPGSVLVATLEGTRTFLVEVQGLVVFSKLPIPRRVALGIDAKRLELLLAILQKHANLPVGTMDVFVNVAGGIKLSDPACDLGICLAIFSSLKNKSLGKTVAIAEVGLLGELRLVGSLEKRIKEAKKLGFKNVISTKTHKTLTQVLKDLT